MKNPSSGSQVVHADRRTGRRTDTHEEANSHFPRFCKRTWYRRICLLSVQFQFMLYSLNRWIVNGKARTRNSLQPNRSLYLGVCPKQMRKICHDSRSLTSTWSWVIPNTGQWQVTISVGNLQTPAITVQWERRVMSQNNTGHKGIHESNATIRNVQQYGGARIDRASPRQTARH